MARSTHAGAKRPGRKTSSTQHRSSAPTPGNSVPKGQRNPNPSPEELDALLEQAISEDGE